MIEYLPEISAEIDVDELKNANPLTLSFIGDGVHTLFIRAAIMKKNPYRNDVLHELTASFVCASAQAADAKIMLPLLNPEERQIFNRAKNGKINTVPKHATVYQYQLATAFEAVTGFLYLTARHERLAELYSIIYKDRLPQNDDTVS